MALYFGFVSLQSTQPREKPLLFTVKPALVQIYLNSDKPSENYFPTLKLFSFFFNHCITKHLHIYTCECESTFTLTNALKTEHKRETPNNL